MSNIEAFRKRVLGAVDWAESVGITLMTNRWSVRWNGGNWDFTLPNRECCPLGAVLILEQPDLEGEKTHPCPKDAEKLFAIEDSEMQDFLVGVDYGLGSVTANKQNPFFLFGVEMRERAHKNGNPIMRSAMKVASKGIQKEREGR